ncbi:MAG TPA: ferritin-like domain-containing protein [Clostridia bacterium]
MENNERRKRFKLDLPYPEVEPVCDPKTVMLIKEDYAGCQSELTAINVYIYQRILMNDVLDELAGVLLGIAIVEMEHLELLGMAIKNLGGDPEYEVGCRMWTADYVIYTKNPKEMLLANIEGEKTAIRNYRRHIRMIDNRQVQKLLERIILDEELHIDIFSSLLNRLNDDMLR